MARNNSRQRKSKKKNVKSKRIPKKGGVKSKTKPKKPTPKKPTPKKSSKSKSKLVKNGSKKKPQKIVTYPSDRDADVKRCAVHKGKSKECRSDNCWYDYDTEECHPRLTKEEVKALQK